MKQHLHSYRLLLMVAAICTLAAFWLLGARIGVEQTPRQVDVVISYEDASMNVREVTRPFTIMVEEMPYVDPGIDFPVVDPQPTEEPSLFTVQNVVLFVVAAGVAGATGYMTVLKIKAKRSEFDDEDL